MTAGPKAPKAVFLALAATLLLAPVTTVRAQSPEPVWQHATALSGTPKYGPDVTHFEYVNPEAPKGGSVRLADTGGFDTFNPVLPKGNPAPGIGLIYDTLMETALDEVDISGSYGVIAEAMRYPDDYSWVEYRLNPKARWHDGKPITVSDVIWSFQKITEVSPPQKFYYKNVVRAEERPGGVVRFEFDVKGNRELPHIMSQLLILPQHWWEGTNAQGEKRDIARGTLEPPLGNGPYRIKSFVAGRDVVYERVPDYWGADLPIRVGTNNFDEIRYVVFMDQAVELEAFKGDQYDFRQELSASQWAKAYDFPAIREGRVVKEEFVDKGSGRMQAFVPNLRRPKFQDARVRQALNYAYDFETTNEIVSANLLKRIGSYFAGTDLGATGLPTGKELEILETLRGQIPEEVFTTEFRNPVGGNPENVRNNLRQAVRLLTEAGFKRENGQIIDPTSGEQFTIEFLYFDKSAERTLLPYAKNLESIGIRPVLRLVDQPQYINRINSRDFDMATLVWGQSLSPGNEQRDFWGSEAADREQSRNYAGIKNPAVDTLIDRIVFAKDRAELVAATKALDRVLLWNHYVVPQFYADKDRTVRWNRFGHPAKMPEFTFAFPTIWWYDAALAAKTGAPK
ncbi:extracellular solute-binding protein [Pannonibacter tanglangensis]|uniref:ABC transporter substrate-binding protein n=1 Tax=Pannonibacter tanglangensis TaxID=2750084 RepID=A0ABW9ZN12_9HYPH|nr:extracellular solute-binding protein [Pannonibacter sp. XCT-34]NBN65769.1 ABC transporter substrate-binding protein [Pannonibacter sp. XCT-34]